MRSLVLAASVMLAFPMMASATDLSFPSAAPIASIVVPDSWNPKETVSGMEAKTDDGAIYFSIDVAEAATMDQVINEAVAFLDKNNVKLDAGPPKVTEDQLNGMKRSKLDYEGDEPGGRANVSISLVIPKEGSVLVVTYWGSKGTQDKYTGDVADILASLKPV